MRSEGRQSPTPIDRQLDRIGSRARLRALKPMIAAACKQAIDMTPDAMEPTAID